MPHLGPANAETLGTQPTSLSCQSSPFCYLKQDTELGMVVHIVIPALEAKADSLVYTTNEFRDSQGYT